MSTQHFTSSTKRKNRGNDSDEENHSSPNPSSRKQHQRQMTLEDGFVGKIKDYFSRTLPWIFTPGVKMPAKSRGRSVKTKRRKKESKGMFL